MPARGAKSNAESIALQSDLDDLGLSVRTRNAVRSLGCNTVEDLLNLDLAAGPRGLGRKTKEELLLQLERAGFRHPMLDAYPATELHRIDESLERLQARVDEALGAVSREIRLLRQRLRNQ